LSSSGPWTVVSPTGGVAGTTFTDTSVSNGTPYFYRVKANNGTLSSDPALSTPASVTPAVPPPPDRHAPLAVPSPSGTAAGWYVTFHWSTASDSPSIGGDTPSGVANYQIYECYSDGTLVSGESPGAPMPGGLIAAPATSWADPNPLSKGTHYFRIIAADVQGNPPANSTWATSWAAATQFSVVVAGKFTALSIYGKNGSDMYVSIAAPGTMPVYGSPVTYFDLAGATYSTPQWRPVAKKTGPTPQATVSLPDFGMGFTIMESSSSSGSGATPVPWSNWVVNL
jgi:hypothetical protein